MRRESFLDLLAFVFVLAAGGAWLYDSYTLPSSSSVWPSCGLTQGAVLLFLQCAFVFGAAEAAARGWGRRRIEQSLARPEAEPLDDLLGRSLFRDCPRAELGIAPTDAPARGRIHREMHIARFWLASGARNLRVLSLLALLVGLLGVSIELMNAARGVALTGGIWIGGVDAVILEILRLVGATIFVALPALWLSESLSGAATRLSSARAALREGRGRGSGAAR